MKVSFASATYLAGQSLRDAYAESPQEAHNALLSAIEEVVSTQEGRRDLAAGIDALFDELEPLRIEKAFFWPAIEDLKHHDPYWLPRGKQEGVIRACCDGRFEEPDNIEYTFYKHGGIRALLWLIRVLNKNDAVLPVWRALRAKVKLVQNVAQLQGTDILETWVGTYDCSPQLYDADTDPPRLGLHPRRRQASSNMGTQSRPSKHPSCPAKPRVKRQKATVGGDESILKPSSRHSITESITADQCSQPTLIPPLYSLSQQPVLNDMAVAILPRSNPVPKSPPRSSQPEETSDELWQLWIASP